jgi:hypothetical protein
MNLKAEDIIYFDKLQRDYNNTINYFNDLTEHMESWRDSLKTNEHFKKEGGLDNDIGKIQSRDKNQTTNSFVLNICDYFEKNYGISTLTNNKVRDILEYYINYEFTNYKGKHDNLHYTEVIKYICDKLKISDFNSREIEDLRKRINDKLHWFWDKERITEKDNKIKFTDYGFRVDKNWNDTMVSLKGDTISFFEDMFTAYNYITIGKINAPTELMRWLKPISDFSKKVLLEDFYKAHEVNEFGIESVRFYKNGNMEIKLSASLFKNRLVRVMKGGF